MRSLALAAGLFLAASCAFAGEPDSRPAETRYEVYFFHASWRCVNCNNAEGWTREEVEVFAKSNEADAVVFTPVEMEKNGDLVKATKAQRVDVVVAEIVGGKGVRFANLGNLLPLVKGQDEAKAKEAVKRFVRDGLKQFDAKAKNPWLKIPEQPEQKPEK